MEMQYIVRYRTTRKIEVWHQAQLDAYRHVAYAGVPPYEVIGSIATNQIYDHRASDVVSEALSRVFGTSHEVIQVKILKEFINIYNQRGPT